MVCFSFCYFFDMMLMLVYQVDIDEAQEIMDYEDVQSVPTFVFYRDDARVHQFSGFEPDQLINTVQKYL